MKFRILILMCLLTPRLHAQVNPENLNYPPVAWKSTPPADCPFPASKEIKGITLLGVKSGFHFGDTWYPTWADGGAWRLDGLYDSSQSGGEAGAERTGHAVIEGDDPLNLKVYSLGISFASPNPYHGRYPCGSLIYEGVWYYGTYCLLKTRREPLRFGDAENLPKYVILQKMGSPIRIPIEKTI